MKYHCVLLAFLTVVATATVALAQNSPLPLATGQDRDEEVKKALTTITSEAPLQEKAVACKRLGVIGTANVVPVLAELLDQEQMAHYARIALEPLPYPEVDQALRDALDRLDGLYRIGVINTIGNRRDTGAISSLVKLMETADAATAGAAAGALGRIATEETARVLRKALAGSGKATATALGDACLVCAQTLHREGKSELAVELLDGVRNADMPKHIVWAATRDAIVYRGDGGLPILIEQLHNDDADFFLLALQCARVLDHVQAAKTLLEQLDRVPEGRKSYVLLALGDLGQRSAVPALVEAVRGGTAAERLAAIRSLGQLGSADEVQVLVEAALQSDAAAAEAARQVLKTLPGEDVDRRLVPLLDSKNQQRLALGLDVVGYRRIHAAMPKLLAAADSSVEEIQLAAIGALGETMSLEDMDQLVQWMLHPRSDKAAEAVKQALKAASIRMPDPDQCAAKLAAHLEQASLEDKRFLMDLLNSVGGSQALKTVVAAAREGSPEVQDIATQVLGEWMSPDVADDLLDLAKTLDDERFRIRALRAYIRIIRQFGLPDDQRLAMCEAAMQVAGRNAERELIVTALGRIQNAKALRKVVEYLGDDALKAEAALSAVDIAEKILARNRRAVADAMQKVLDSDPPSDVAGRARRLLNRAK